MPAVKDVVLSSMKSLEAPAGNGRKVRAGGLTCGRWGGNVAAACGCGCRSGCSCAAATGCSCGAGSGGCKPMVDWLLSVQGYS